MKRFLALLLFVILICTAFSLCSCDQETVDSVRSDLMGEMADLLSPILKESRPEEGENADTTPSNDGGESIPSYDTPSDGSSAPSDSKNEDVSSDTPDTDGALVDIADLF